MNPPKVNLFQAIFTKLGGGVHFIASFIHLILIFIVWILILGYLTDHFNQFREWILLVSIVVGAAYIYTFYFSWDDGEGFSLFKNTMCTIAFVPVVLSIIVGVLIKSFIIVWDNRH